MIDLLALMRRGRDVARPRDHEAWIELLGWKRAVGHFWIEPGCTAEWTFRSALRISAEAETARALRALGWYAPHALGRVCIGRLCRAPGTWMSVPGVECRAVKGSGGRWLSLAQAARAAGLRYWTA
jgi:hypothetical protein